MVEIKLTKRYPQSRTEDIVDAYMRGWNDALDAVQNGKFIINDDRKTENSSEKPNNSTISKMEQVEKPQTDWIKRKYAIKAVDICVQDGWGRISPSQAKQNIRDLISEKDEPTEVTYQNCSDALLKMWMDNVLTDAEYNRIMDKLNNAQRKDEPQTDVYEYHNGEWVKPDCPWK